MDAKKIKEELTNEQIITLYKSLGGSDYKYDSNGDLVFITLCHGGNSHKLYYYNENKLFNCYTHCNSFDIFKLVQKIKNCSFIQSINYICNLFNIKNNISEKGFTIEYLINDWDQINKYDRLKVQIKQKELKFFDDNILNYFSNLYHQLWIDDGISIESMKKFGIKFDIVNNRIIIPHRDKDGNLIGIRCRNLDEDIVKLGKKYMPIYIEGEGYNHPLGINLYALHENLKSIQRIGKLIIFEAEKSCLQCEDYFQEDNFSTALCGSNITNYQIDLIIKSGVKEIFLAFDKQFKKKDTQEAYDYAEKLKKIALKLAPYFQTWILYDNFELLNYKDSPSDKGKDVLLTLMKNKYEISTLDEI